MPSTSFGPVYGLENRILNPTIIFRFLTRHIGGELRVAVAQVFELSHAGRAARHHAEGDHVQESVNLSSARSMRSHERRER